MSDSPGTSSTAALTISQLLRQATTQLEEVALEGSAPRLEAELLLGHVLDASRTSLFTRGDQPISDPALERFHELLTRRLTGEPLAYLTGERGFWTLDLKVGPSVLIPRPETELLVEASLERIPKKKAVRVIDLGTGSGAIALALASERPEAIVVASDISTTALATARANAADLGLERVMFLESSWFEAIEGTFDLVVSNPPYIAADDPHLQRGDLRFEPATALTPGDDSLLAYRTIIGQVMTRLTNQGWLLFEHGYDQGDAVRQLLSAAGFSSVETLKDLQGHDRVSLGQKV